MNTKRIRIDIKMIIVVSFMCIISLISIYSASMYLSKTLGNLVLKQGLWYLIGIILIIIVLKLKNNFFIKLAPFMYILNCILLLGLLFFAPEINGSKCWYVINGLGSFQPSEFMKVSLILMEAFIVDKINKKYDKNSLKKELILIISLIITFLIPTILTFLEPDTGAVIIYFIITILMLLASGVRIRWFIIISGIISIIISIFFGLFFYKQDVFINIFGSNFFYRIDRIINWKNGSGMQLENSLVAIGSSSYFGHGFNKTPLYFPEAGTDFIFTVFASNFGLIGCVILLSIIIFLDIHIINIALSSNNKTNKYILSGVLGVFIYQQIQNISMTIGLLPITGITLPLISYGGSSLLAYMILIGFCMYSYNELY